MRLLLVGANHRSASIDVRERLDLARHGLDRAADALARRPGVREAVVVSTCNRVEMYVACEDVDEARGELERFLVEDRAVSPGEIRPHLYASADEAAVRHLFRVAAGLESLVVGEPQILGQVKDAYGAASRSHTAGPLLNRLFHWAFGVGKRVRAETALAEGAVSVGFAAVSLARKIFGRLDGCRVLVAGTGEMGRLTAVHLRGQGIAELAVTSRTFDRAQELAAEVGGHAVPWERLPEALTASDIVVTCTGSPAPILDAAMVRRAMPSSRVRPLFLIDIAVPRDVAPEAGEVEQVFLYNIDDLQGIVRENLQRRGSEVSRAEAIVDAEVERFIAWQRSRRAVPTLVALRHHFEAVRQAELQRLGPKLAALPPDVRRRLEEVTRLIVEKLLHGPTERLKTLEDPDEASAHAATINRLFGLPNEGTEVPPGDSPPFRGTEVLPGDRGHADRDQG